jgi:DNA-binding response OmpR family regulator
MEDDDIIRGLIVRVLRMNGHTPLAYADAGPALSDVDFRSVDLIVTDLSMPTHGEEAIRRIRCRGVQAPIIVVSGQLHTTKSDYLKALGVQETLEKPFSLRDLITLVKKWT